MARSSTYAARWLPYDGRRVVVKNVAYVLHVTQYTAIYPYPEEQVSVSAEPINKHTVYYQNTRKYLGDDWALDVLDSDVDTEAAFWAAVTGLTE